LLSHGKDLSASSSLSICPHTSAQKGSVSFIISLHLSTHVSTAASEHIPVKFDIVTLMKVCRENPHLIKIRQKYQALYMKNSVLFFVGGDIKSLQKPLLQVKWY
jgi:hypothetical protein